MTLGKVRFQDYLPLYHAKADGVRPHFRRSLQHTQALLTQAGFRMLYVSKKKRLSHLNPNIQETNI